MRGSKRKRVCGSVEPDSMGTTLTHEHLLIDCGVLYVPATSKTGPPIHDYSDAPFDLRHVGWIQRYPYSHKGNLHLTEFDVCVEELEYFKSAGGSTIVDNTTHGLGRDVERLQQLSTQTGVNIVAGAGFYVGPSHPLDMSTRTEEQLIDTIIHEVVDGCDGTKVKCGLIGEIGCSWPLTGNEKKVLRAAAQAQERLGCAVNIHPGRDEKAPAEIVRILQEAGCDISKTTMSHLDRTLMDFETCLEFAALGSYCEWDLFGVETSYYQQDKQKDMPSDAVRMRFLERMIAEGYEDRLLISHDIHTKYRLMKYGGHGYSHILVDIVPRMLLRGVTQATIDKILVDNPRRWLTFIR
ncbi:PREDICTED: phosphotriesterase-related protein-like isoform X2 [Priapulus caudatus]|uniref:Phosphotriesterase-related protein n=1 Tax=Priapulus caudatus TaxID=37621 RepID=A0ABM1DRK9_PRICU|nr:PREDICTED: phosphotriesterase-related protein-like isoform X2 [Priapulus caudatus]